MSRIELNRGSVALRMLDDPAFCAQWTSLCARCPWSTSYQLPAFATTWYRVYAQSFEPVIITAHTEAGELAGVLCLAASRTDESLSIAGQEQCEYQTWINDPAQAADFPAEAIEAVRKAFPHDVLEFRYLPPSAPLDWLKDRHAQSRAVLVKKKRPLLRFSEMTQDSLNKANNKKRLKVLKKHGEIEFIRITEVAALDSMLDELIPCYDLRLGAMHGYEPFGKDPFRKTFQLELMKQPGFLHVSVLRVGKLLAAAQVNVCDKQQLHLHLICYNPLLAKHSPGKFHVHLLAQMLIADQYQEIDLTPGGDPYKERFANAHDTAHILSFHPTRRSRFIAALRAHGDVAMRRALSAARIHPARARDFVQSLAPPFLGKSCSSAAAALRDRIGFGPALRLYVKPIASCDSDRSEPPIFSRDRIDHLLAYHPPPGGLLRKQFLSDAMERLELGQHLYSVVRDGSLRFVGWLMERPSEVFVSRAFPGLILPQGHALIMDLRPLDPQCDAELGPVCLAAMLADLAAGKDASRVMMAIHADHPAVPILEPAGFVWEGSLSRGKIHGAGAASKSFGDIDSVASTVR